MEERYTPERPLRPDILLLLLIIACAVSFLSFTFSGSGYHPFADEGYYLKYASEVAQKGLSEIPALCREYVSTDRDHVFPSPLRAGFIAVSALWVKIFGVDFAALAYLSLFSFALLLVISFYFSRKYFGEVFALLLSVSLAFSPLAMAVSRRALMDMTANLFSLFSLWLFFDYTHRRSRLKASLFVTVFAAAVLIKESSALLAFIFIAWVLCLKFAYKKRAVLTDLLALPDDIRPPCRPRCGPGPAWTMPRECACSASPFAKGAGRSTRSISTRPRC